MYRSVRQQAPEPLKIFIKIYTRFWGWVYSFYQHLYLVLASYRRTEVHWPTTCFTCTLSHVPSWHLQWKGISRSRRIYLCLSKMLEGHWPSKQNWTIQPMDWPNIRNICILSSIWLPLYLPSIGRTYLKCWLMGSPMIYGNWFPVYMDAFLNSQFTSKGGRPDFCSVFVKRRVCRVSLDGKKRSIKGFGGSS